VLIKKEVSIGISKMTIPKFLSRRIPSFLYLLNRINLIKNKKMQYNFSNSNLTRRKINMFGCT